MHWIDNGRKCHGHLTTYKAAVLWLPGFINSKAYAHALSHCAIAYSSWNWVRDSQEDACRIFMYMFPWDHRWEQESHWEVFAAGLWRSVGFCSSTQWGGIWKKGHQLVWTLTSALRWVKESHQMPLRQLLLPGLSLALFKWHLLFNAYPKIFVKCISVESDLFLVWCTYLSRSCSVSVHLLDWMLQLCFLIFESQSTLHSHEG